MLELLFLLLPVAAGYGWFMGRNSILQEQRKSRKNFQASYSKGLNYLLSDQQDKAVDELISTLTVSSETVETHFALAKLFRKRGQIEKALKIHLYLVEQAKLNEDDIGRAVFELAEDFVSAGMYDKAEAEYRKLLADQKYKTKSLYALLAMYRVTKDWHKGVELGKELKQQDAECRHIVANFYCELAQEQSLEKRCEYLQQALEMFPFGQRANIELAKVYQQQHRFDEALDLYLDVLERSPSLLTLYIQDIRDCCHDRLAWQRYFELLAKHDEDKPLASAIIAKAENLSKEHTLEDAVRYLMESLRRKPNIKVFSYLMDLHQRYENVLDSEELQQRIAEMVQDFIAITKQFYCQHCGHQSNHHHWQCPRCQHWETIKPCQGLVGE